MANLHVILKPLLFAASVATAMVGGFAAATEPPEKVGATREVVAPPGRGMVRTPATQAPKKKPLKPRRSVPQIVDSVPSAARPVGVQPIPLPAQHAIPAPVTIPGPTTFIPSGCQGAACTDSSGNRYQGGVGTTLIGPEGRLCSHNGVTVQCF